MKTIVQHACEICGESYDLASNAATCEARGAGRAYPKGLMHVEHASAVLTVAVAVETAKVWNHANTTTLFGCMHNGGEQVGPGRYGTVTNFEPVEFDPAWLKLPPFRRLALWLAEHGVTPLVWTAGKSIPLYSLLTGNN